MSALGMRKRWKKETFERMNVAVKSATEMIPKSMKKRQSKLITTSFNTKLIAGASYRYYGGNPQLVQWDLG